MAVQEQPRRSAEEQCKLDAAIRDMFEERIRFNQYLGFRVLDLAAEHVSLGFDMRPELVGHFHYGRLHGGVISAVLDATGGLAAMWSLAEFHAAESAEQTLQRFAFLGTVDLRVDYLRPGVGSRFVASAQVVRLGRRVAAIRMQLNTERDVLVATGNATYIVS